MQRHRQADQFTGVSFFDIGSHSIQVRYSMLTGKEQVWLDDQLVSSFYSWRFHAVHRFDVDAEPVEVHIKLCSFLKGPLQISLWRAGQQVDCDEVTYEQIRHGMGLAPTKQQSWPAFLGSLLLFGLGGAAVGFLVATAAKDFAGGS